MKRMLLLFSLCAAACAATSTPVPRERVVITGLNLTIVTDTSTQIVVKGQNIKIAFVTP